MARHPSITMRRSHLEVRDMMASPSSGLAHIPLLTSCSSHFALSEIMATINMKTAQQLIVKRQGMYERLPPPQI